MSTFFKNNTETTQQKVALTTSAVENAAKPGDCPSPTPSMEQELLEPNMDWVEGLEELVTPNGPVKSAFTFGRVVKPSVGGGVGAKEGETSSSEGSRNVLFTPSVILSRLNNSSIGPPDLNSTVIQNKPSSTSLSKMVAEMQPTDSSKGPKGPGGKVPNRERLSREKWKKDQKPRHHRLSLAKGGRLNIGTNSRADPKVRPTA
jgi:hypothetical protein